MISSLKYYKWILSITAYALLAYGIYHPFVEQGLLPGKIDAWFNLGIFQHYANSLDSFFFDTPVRIPNFPEGKVFLYGESSVLTGFIYWLLTKLLNTDLSAYISLYAMIQVLNAWSMGLLVKTYFKTNQLAAFLSGLFFSFSAFNLAFYDNIVYSIWFPLFFSLFLLSKASSSARPTVYYAFFGVLFYAQLYFSVYNFFMGSIILFFLLFRGYSQWHHAKRSLQTLLISLPLSFAFLYFYGFHSRIPASYDQYVSLTIIDSLGFTFQDLFRSFKTNIAYGSFSFYQGRVNDYWTLGNSGFIFFICSLFGLWKSQLKTKLWLLPFMLTGLLLAFGPFWGQLSSPGILLYEWLPWLKKFKLIFKFYYLWLVGACLFAGIGFFYFTRRIRKPSISIILTLLTATLFLAEHLPAKATEYSVPFSLPSCTEQDLDEMQQAEHVILFLPMCAPMFPDPANSACFVEGRAIEFKYLYWQAHLQINMLNGSNGTIPQNRQAINQLFEEKNFLDAIESLKLSHQLSHIYYDKTVGFSFEQAAIEDLKKYFTDYTEYEDYIIFRP